MHHVHVWAAHTFTITPYPVQRETETDRENGTQTSAQSRGVFLSSGPTCLTCWQ